MRKGRLEQDFKMDFALQWGRNLIVAEGSCTVLVLLGGGELQWGRNLIVAEGVDQLERALWQV